MLHQQATLLVGHFTDKVTFSQTRCYDTDKVSPLPKDTSPTSHRLSWFITKLLQRQATSSPSKKSSKASIRRSLDASIEDKFWTSFTSNPKSQWLFWRANWRSYTRQKLQVRERVFHQIILFFLLSLPFVHILLPLSPVQPSSSFFVLVLFVFKSRVYKCEVCFESLVVGEK